MKRVIQINEDDYWTADIFFFLQWNEKSLVANGQEFKRYIDVSRDKLAVVFIRETWLKPL